MNTTIGTERTFTRLAGAARENMKGFFDRWHSYEETSDLIDEFKNLPADGKGTAEKKIVNILSVLTGYKDKYGSQWLCGDYTDAEDVNKSAAEYLEFAKELSRNADFDRLFYNELSNIYKNYASSGDYITRLVRDRMSVISPELLSENTPTRVLIFRQFLKAAEFPKRKCMSRDLRDYVFEITGTSETSDAEEILKGISNIQDGIFSRLDEVYGYSKDSREQWEPLMWSSELANGTFNNQYTTRIKLYWFAVIFDMSYYIGEPNEIFDADTDIQTKLFYEYYADNLINNLLNADNPAEIEPSGHGINFKNFIEVIYLYYIRKTGMSACGKLSRAKKMIKECKTSDSRLIESQEQKHREKDTLFYESDLKRMMGLDEEKFEADVKQNYICGRTGVNPIRAASGNIDAADIYEKLLKRLGAAAESAAPVPGADGKTVKAHALPLIEAASGLIKIPDSVQNEELRKILEALQRKFKFVHKKTDIDGILNSMFPTADIENDVSRTKMIILYYYIFMLQNAADEREFKSFDDFYKEFCDEFGILLREGRDKRENRIYRLYYGINDILISSGYQEFNSKNLFDSVILFFAFKNYDNVKKSKKGDAEN
ncbi:MAG: hypothetical protein LUF26_03145 [Firmicutes bacterium]|nr:hypothetical protein [Bacillota bacterium]